MTIYSLDVLLSLGSERTINSQSISLSSYVNQTQIRLIPPLFSSGTSLPLRLNGEHRPYGFSGLGTLGAKTRIDWLIGHHTPTVVECPKSNFLFSQVKF